MVFQRQVFHYLATLSTLSFLIQPINCRLPLNLLQIVDTSGRLSIRRTQSVTHRTRPLKCHLKNRLNPDLNAINVCPIICILKLMSRCDFTEFEKFQFSA